MMSDLNAAEEDQTTEVGFPHRAAKRRSSILKTRQPLSDLCGSDNDATEHVPNKKSRRVSFSNKPEVREIPKVDSREPVLDGEAEAMAAHRSDDPSSALTVTSSASDGAGRSDFVASIQSLLLPPKMFNNQFGFYQLTDNNDFKTVLNTYQNHVATVCRANLISNDTIEMTDCHGNPCLRQSSVEEGQEMVAVSGVRSDGSEADCAKVQSFNKTKVFGNESMEMTRCFDGLEGSFTDELCFNRSDDVLRRPSAEEGLGLESVSDVCRDGRKADCAIAQSFNKTKVFGDDSMEMTRCLDGLGGSFSDEECLNKTVLISRSVEELEDDDDEGRICEIVSDKCGDDDDVRCRLNSDDVSGRDAIPRLIDVNSFLSDLQFGNKVVEDRKAPLGLKSEVPATARMASAGGQIAAQTSKSAAAFLLQGSELQQERNSNRTVLLGDDDADMEMTACSLKTIVTGGEMIFDKTGALEEGGVETEVASYLPITIKSGVKRSSQTVLFGEDGGEMEMTACSLKTIVTGGERIFERTGVLEEGGVDMETASYLPIAIKSGVKRSSQTVLCGEDGGGMEMTACSLKPITGVDRIFERTGLLEDGGVETETASYLPITRKSGVKKSSQTGFFGEDGGEMEMTACSLKTIVTAGEMIFDRTGALEEGGVETETASYLPITRKSGVKRSSQTVLFGEDGGEMEMTACSLKTIITDGERIFDRIGGGVETETASYLPNAMQTTVRRSSQTVLFGEDGGEMEMTRCSSKTIDDDGRSIKKPLNLEVDQSKASSLSIVLKDDGTSFIPTTQLPEYNDGLEASNSVSNTCKQLNKDRTVLFCDGEDTINLNDCAAKKIKLDATVMRPSDTKTDKPTTYGAGVDRTTAFGDDSENEMSFTKCLGNVATIQAISLSQNDGDRTKIFVTEGNELTECIRANVFQDASQTYRNWDLMETKVFSESIQNRTDRRITSAFDLSRFELPEKWNVSTLDRSVTEVPLPKIDDGLLLTAASFVYGNDKREVENVSCVPMVTDADDIGKELAESIVMAEEPESSMSQDKGDLTSAPVVVEQQSGNPENSEDRSSTKSPEQIRLTTTKRPKVSVEEPIVFANEELRRIDEEVKLNLRVKGELMKSVLASLSETRDQIPQIQPTDKFSVWDLDEWKSSGCSFSFLSNTLFLHVRFGPEVSGAEFCGKPAQEISTLTMKSYPGENMWPECELAHLLIYELLNESDIRQYRDTSQLHKVLHEVLVWILKAERVKKDITDLDPLHIRCRVEIEGHRVSVDYSKAHVSFMVSCDVHLLRQLDTCPAWTVSYISGHIRKEDVLDQIKQVKPGFSYLGDVYRQIQTWLDTLQP